MLRKVAEVAVLVAFLLCVLMALKVAGTEHISEWPWVPYAVAAAVAWVGYERIKRG